MTREQRIIENLKNTVHAYKVSDWALIDILESELTALKSEPPTELFERVVVNSKNDLPKESGFYCVMKKSKVIVSIKFLSKKTIRWQDIEWYLRPINH